MQWRRATDREVEISLYWWIRSVCGGKSTNPYRARRCPKQNITIVDRSVIKHQVVVYTCSYKGKGEVRKTQVFIFSTYVSHLHTVLVAVAHNN